jgi:hypothetical protein
VPRAGLHPLREPVIFLENLAHDASGAVIPPPKTPT